jgi:E3 ubiquitin-protein ligase SDIR1
MAGFVLTIIILFAMDNDVLDIIALTLLSSVGFTLCVRALMLARGLRLDGFDGHGGRLTLREQMLLHQAMYGDSFWMRSSRPNSTHMRLSMMDRDFNPNDYDMLLRLDDEVRANTFTGIPQSQINRLPTFVLKDDGSNSKGGKSEASSNSNTVATLSPKSVAASLSSPAAPASSASLSSSSSSSSSSALKAGLKGATDSARKCAVCLEAQISGQTLRSLPCLHNFHIDCIDPWLRIKPVCPVCHIQVVLTNGRDS